MSHDRVPDVLANRDARALLLELDARGISLVVRRGKLATAQADRLTEADRVALRQHKPDLLVLVLLTDAGVLDRLLALRAGHVVTEPVLLDHACYHCGEPLPPERRWGRCGWCALAARLYAGGPLPPDLIALFPDDIRGAPADVPASALPFDRAVPA